MIAGLLLNQLAERVQNLDEIKKDFIVPQKLLTASLDSGTMRVGMRIGKN